jgi:hypothetical protein
MVTLKRRLGTFRNVSSILRLILQVGFIYSDAEYDSPDEKSSRQEWFAYLTLFSWIGLLPYMMIFRKYRLLIQYIQASFVAVYPFMLVTLIILVAFALATLVRDGNSIYDWEVFVGIF